MSDQTRELVAAMMRHVDRRDYYALLDLPRTADATAVAAAFEGLAPRLHPSRIHDSDLGITAARALAMLHDAKATLSDPKRRLTYEREFDRKTVSVPKLVPDAQHERALEQLLVAPLERIQDRRIEVARMLHHRGAHLFNHGDLDAAERYLRRARDLDGSIADHHLRLGWTIFSNRALPAERRLTEARALIEQAVAMNPYGSDARYSMACVWRELGHMDQCKRELEAAARGKPAHAKAEMELAAMRSQERRAGEAGRHGGKVEQTEKKRFGLARLFGRG